MGELKKKLEKVIDEESFLDFLRCLSIEYSNKYQEWCSNSIDVFLECSAEWGQASINGLKYYEKPNNVWRRCAEIIFMEKLYE
ncbi:hypothetical protein [Vallitalea okinawensis]|uniref:hypothetical protein n=1 Tax=Vallitalea okinawensis TaxID=2078660 RepID=UPI000CFBD961|nr:hypothetical protein [Vallitalea okinawensis]